jgi:hypothetical protein
MAGESLPETTEGFDEGQDDIAEQLNHEGVF